jgi:hypothetical protein
MKPVKIDYCKNCEKHFTSQRHEYKQSFKHPHDDDWCASFKDKEKKDGGRK